MKTNKKIYWIAQVVGWTSYCSLLYLSTYLNRPNEITTTLILELLLVSVVSISFTHLMRYFILSAGWLNFKLFKLIPRIFVISVLCAACIEVSISTLEYYLFDDMAIVERPTKMILNTFAFTLLIICWNGIYFTYHFFEKSNKQELVNISLEASKNEIELKNLRSQLNPHFLFNSLNSIRALIDTEPGKAKSAVTTLSNLLRKSLLSGKENLITIEEEMEIVYNYLELERIRFEERLTIEWELDQSLNRFNVPPFSIQMLVENGVKHGISKIVEGGFVKIKTYRNNRFVIVEVENSGQLGSGSDTGIGIANTRRRLDLQYNGMAEFFLKEKENSVLATLKIAYENY